MKKSRNEMAAINMKENEISMKSGIRQYRKIIDSMKASAKIM